MLSIRKLPCVTPIALIMFKQLRVTLLAFDWLKIQKLALLALSVIISTPTTNVRNYAYTWSVGPLWGPTSSWRPFRLAFGPQGLLDFVLCALRVLSPHPSQAITIFQNFLFEIVLLKFSTEIFQDFLVKFLLEIFLIIFMLNLFSEEFYLIFLKFSFIRNDLGIFFESFVCSDIVFRICLKFFSKLNLESLFKNCLFKFLFRIFC